MRIISWNCNMAFRKKYHKMLELKPDLLVLQECENETKLKIALENENYNQIIWHGNNQHKGVAIISFNSTNIELVSDHCLEYQYVIPIKVKSQDKEVNLLCIWAMPHKTVRKNSYIGQVWGAVHHYSNLLNEDSILIGDFNSNSIWDRKKRIGGHSDVVNFLNEKKIYSIYHQKFNCIHGKEPDPTLYLLKKMEKPYHLDYCFASASLFNQETKIEVGKFEHWIKYSDHMPLIIDNVIL